jgi:hypothetical protein
MAAAISRGPTLSEIRRPALRSHFLGRTSAVDQRCPARLRPLFWATVRAAMTPETFETQLLDLRDQFEAWREWHQPVLDFLPEQSTRYEFSGRAAFVETWRFGDEPDLRASRLCRANEEQPQARCHRPLGHQLLHPGPASHEDGWDSARNTRKSALSLLARTRILARADAYRPDPVAYGARRSPIASRFRRKERARQAVRRYLRTPTLGPMTLSR